MERSLPTEPRIEVSTGLKETALIVSPDVGQFRDETGGPEGRARS